jgi:hypothetical protein
MNGGDHGANLGPAGARPVEVTDPHGERSAFAAPQWARDIGLKIGLDAYGLLKAAGVFGDRASSQEIGGATEERTTTLENGGLSAAAPADLSTSG